MKDKLSSSQLSVFIWEITSYYHGDFYGPNYNYLHAILFVEKNLKMKKVKHHCHYTGTYRAVAHNM